MQMHPASADVQQKTLGQLMSSVSKASFQHDTLTAYTTAALKSLRQHSTHAGVQAAGYAALAALLSGHAFGTDTARNALQLAVATLDAHVADAGVQRHAIHVLGLLAASRGKQGDVAVSDAVKAIAAALVAHRSDLRVSTQCGATLLVLFWGGSKASADFTRTQGVKVDLSAALFAAFQAHTSHDPAAVQLATALLHATRFNPLDVTQDVNLAARYAEVALEKLAALPLSAFHLRTATACTVEAVDAACIIDAVTASMLQLANMVRSQRQACTFFCTFVSSVAASMPPGFKLTIPSKVIEYIASAMQTHGADAELQKQACAAVSAVCSQTRLDWKVKHIVSAKDAINAARERFQAGADDGVVAAATAALAAF
jgi:hypothetical protein